MSATQTIGLAQRQTLALTPAIRTALALLQYPADRIESVLADEAAANPFLDYEAPRASVMRSAHDVALDTVASSRSLHEDLCAQIALRKLEPGLSALATRLVGELSADGYLEVPEEELAHRLGVSRDALGEGIGVLQDCAPVGVGARDLAECLELQLCDQGVVPAIARALVSNLDAVARQDWPRLARATGLPRAELPALIARLQALSPRPVDSAPARTTPLVPDLVLERDAARGWVVRLGAEYLPRARVNHGLLARAGGSAFADSCRSRAEALISALRFRGDTLQRVGEAIVTTQGEFFSEGAAALKPLSRAEVAARLGVHPSTVSRAVTGKAVACDGQLHPLAMFFSNAIPHRRGPDMSAFAVRRRIAELIAQEPCGQPLSDAEISRRLQAEGVDIARRTVAKYRQYLRVPASGSRRRAAIRTAIGGRMAGRNRRRDH